METVVALLFIACLVVTYIIFSAYYKPGKHESNQDDLFGPPKTLSDLSRAFREVLLLPEKGKQVLVADVYTVVPDQDSLDMIETDMAYFFKKMAQHFPKIRPDIARFTYYQLSNKRSAVFLIEFDMNDINQVDSLVKKGFYLFDLAKSFKKIDVEVTDQMLLDYCGKKSQRAQGFCQRYSA